MNCNNQIKITNLDSTNIFIRDNKVVNIEGMVVSKTELLTTYKGTKYFKILISNRTMRQLLLCFYGNKFDLVRASKIFKQMNYKMKLNKWNDLSISQMILQ